MDLLRSLCCCEPATDDDYSGPYERLNEDAAVTTVRGGLNRVDGPGYANGGVDEVDGRGSSEERGPPRTSEEEEEDQLNRILEATQHNIIDVTHLEGLSLNTTDYIERARNYEDAVKTHDARVGKSAHSAPKSPGKLSRRRLLEDSGNRAADWLGRAPVSAQQLEDIRQMTVRMHEAVTGGIQVTHKTELVVQMDMDL